MEKADVLSRFGGRVIDCLVWLSITVVAAAPFELGGALWGSGSELTTAHRLLAGGFGLAGIFIYETLFVSAMGATPGKRLVGIEVIEPGGGPPDLVSAAIRISPLLVVGGIGVAAPVVADIANGVLLTLALGSAAILFVDPNRQAVWDRLADTTVVRRCR